MWNIYNKYSIYLLLLIIVSIIILLQNYYYKIINKYFRNINNTIIYDYYLKNCIQVISKKNYYMNYGLWDDKNITLYKANKKLCDFIYEKGKINNHDKFTILDVGCGYGVQDILWSKRISKSSEITAVDISKKQIKYANKKIKNNFKIKKKIQYIECDAHNLLDKFDTCKFNRVISLESAFHYSDRSIFFKNVSNLLTNDGVFIISDIILKTNNNSTIKNIFIKLASDFLCIPEKNLITLDKWKNDIMKNDLSIVELYNITDKTFNSYYDYFFKNYIKKKKLPPIFYTILYNIFNNVQPFDYVVAVCKKKHSIL